MRTPVAAVLGAVAILGGGLVLAGCGGGGGGSTTPATTAADGRNVYDPSHTGIRLPPGPKFIIRMPDPGEGSQWRLMGTDSVGGVSLSGMEQPDGGGNWNFDTIGAGSGVLEFQKFAAGSDDAAETVTFEVDIK